MEDGDDITTSQPSPGEVTDFWDKLLKEYDEKTSARVEKLENQIDQYEDALGTYLVKLSERDLSVKDSRILSVLLHCIGDLIMR